MLGNVWEVCQDWFSVKGQLRAGRGGSYFNTRKELSRRRPLLLRVGRPLQRLSPGSRSGRTVRLLSFDRGVPGPARKTFDLGRV